MKAWRPSMWLPIIMIMWGGVMIGMGFVHNFRDLLITRIFLGATEAGLFPGVSFFLTQCTSLLSASSGRGSGEKGAELTEIWAF